LAAEQGSADAQYELGSIYFWRYARSRKKEDHDEAAKWLKKALDNGNVFAKTMYESLH